MSRVLKNKSSAYGYNYTSLADIASQGFEIPKMRVKPTEFGDYIEYLDEEGNWQIGARIVVPEMKGKNAAQMYGAALTYARRYATLNALRLSCSDDATLESTGPVENSRPTKSNLAMQINACKSVDELEELWHSSKDSERQSCLQLFSRKKEDLKG